MRQMVGKRKLIRPDRKYLQSYEEAREEYRLAFQPGEFPFLDLSAEEFIEKAPAFEKGKELPHGWVPATYLWLVNETEFLAEVSIRHELTEALLRFGGNVGYWVRISAWKQGIGTELLRRALRYIRGNLPMDRVLITCNDDHFVSARIIEKNGGILQDRIENPNGERAKITRRYWIPVGNCTEGRADGETDDF